MIADPEITIVKLQHDQPFVILATDGVWEFMSSQKAVDIVSWASRWRSHLVPPWLLMAFGCLCPRNEMVPGSGGKLAHSP